MLTVFTLGSPYVYANETGTRVASTRISDYGAPLAVAAVSPLASEAAAQAQSKTAAEPVAAPAMAQPVTTASIAPVAPVTPAADAGMQPQTQSQAKSETPAPDFNGDQPMNVTANELVYEQNLNRVTAQGGVDITQEGRRLQADKVIYDIKADKVFAQGNVVLTDVTGDVHKAEQVEMEQAFKQGFVKGLSSILSDGSRITAREGMRVNAEKIILKDAWYTPCKPCQAKPNETPDWNVKAKEVTLDQVNHRVVYKDAKFELFGIPVAYTPYLSHPDGTLKQKSGLLSPRFGFGSQLGGFLENKYYHALAPDKDLTTGLMITGQEGAMVSTEYRQRFENAKMSIGGSITNSTRPKEDDFGNDERSNDEVRGNVRGEGKWDMTDKWRSGYKVNWASDDQYLRQYKMPSEDVLQNEIYAERFDERDYARVRAMSFQDTRVTRADIDQPHVVPWIEVEHLTDPKAILGGRGKVSASTVGLVRDGSAQDTQRFSGKAEWNRRTILPAGIVNDTDLTVRGDLYASQDRFAADLAPGQSSEDTSSRKFAQAHTQFGYPLSKRLDKGDYIVEPRVVLTGGTDVRDLRDIPNEDSQDVDFSASQLFEAERFAGYDRIDDGNRVTYGLSNQYISDKGTQIEAFGGQSQRLSDDNNPFPDGSGLEDTRSDWVGRLRYLTAGGSSAEYGFRYDQKSLASERQDVTLNLNMDPLSLAAAYFYVAPLAGTDLTEAREQIALAPILKLSDAWWLRGNARYDLSGDQDERGLLTAGVGFDYIGDCITFSMTANRNNLDQAAGTSETEVFFRIGFKNLAEIESSSISFGERTDSDAVEAATTP